MPLTSSMKTHNQNGIYCENVEAYFFSVPCCLFWIEMLRLCFLTSLRITVNPTPGLLLDVILSPTCPLTMCPASCQRETEKVTKRKVSEIQTHCCSTLLQMFLMTRESFVLAAGGNYTGIRTRRPRDIRY